MSAVATFVHRIDQNTVKTITTAYSSLTRIDLIVPQNIYGDGIKGTVSVLRIYGTSKTGGSNKLTACITFNQAGDQVWLPAITVDITDAPNGGGAWCAMIPYNFLGVELQSQLTEKTISVWAFTNSGTATTSDVHFLWSE